MGLVVLGLQQSAVWGWLDARTIGSIAAGLVLLAGFVAFELRNSAPLIQLRIFAGRAFAVDNLVLALMSAVFVPFFFFASVYAQASLGYSATEAGLFLLVFFAGFATAAQWGGRILDKRGARPAIVLGCVLSADALNRAPDTSYGEVTGVTQTVRNLGASLGLAVMGSLFIAGHGHFAAATPLDVAESTQTVVWIMAGIMAAAFVVAILGLPRGRIETPAEDVVEIEEPAGAEHVPR